MDAWLRNAARRAIGFMPDDEGLALYEAALQAAPLGPILEIGSYCGKSTLYLAAGVREAAADTVLFSVDHHRGSEEHQPGEEYHDPALVDGSGRVDTFPGFRDTIGRAGLDETVVAVVGDSHRIARHWATPLALLLLDGGHSRNTAHGDYELWSRHVMPGGLIAIHDVFEDPAAGGRPPYEVFMRALDSGDFVAHAECGSLRVLKRVVEDLRDRAVGS